MYDGWIYYEKEVKIDKFICILEIEIKEIYIYAKAEVIEQKNDIIAELKECKLNSLYTVISMSRAKMYTNCYSMDRDTLDRFLVVLDVLFSNKQFKKCAKEKGIDDIEEIAKKMVEEYLEADKSLRRNNKNNKSNYIICIDNIGYEDVLDKGEEYEVVVENSRDLITIKLKNGEQIKLLKERFQLNDTKNSEIEILREI